MNNKIFILVFVVVVFVVGGLMYIYNPGPTEYKTPEPVACTADAKMCPDGTYVSRIPPICEFQACPATSTPVFEDGTLPQQQ